MNQPDETKTTIPIDHRKMDSLNELVKETGLGVEELLETIIPLMVSDMKCSGVGLDLAVMRAVNEAAHESKRTRRKHTKTELRLNITACSYGTLAEASIIHGCSIQKALDLFVNESASLCNWQNDGCPL